MNVNKIQAIIGLLVVFTFILVTAIIALTPILGGYPPEPYTEHLKTFSSLYSGVIGLVIGYFFGKGVPNKPQDDL